jgi:hypothetical protein
MAFDSFNEEERYIAAVASRPMASVGGRPAFAAVRDMCAASPAVLSGSRRVSLGCIAAIEIEIHPGLRPARAPVGRARTRDSH